MLYQREGGSNMPAAVYKKKPSHEDDLLLTMATVYVHYLLLTWGAKLQFSQIDIKPFT